MWTRERSRWSRGHVRVTAPGRSEPGGCISEREVPGASPPGWRNGWLEDESAAISRLLSCSPGQARARRRSQARAASPSGLGDGFGHEGAKT